MVEIPFYHMYCSSKKQYVGFLGVKSLIDSLAELLELISVLQSPKKKKNVDSVAPKSIWQFLFLMSPCVAVFYSKFENTDHFCLGGFKSVSFISKEISWARDKGLWG